MGPRDHSILLSLSLSGPRGWLTPSLLLWCLQMAVSGPLPGQMVAPVSQNSLGARRAEIKPGVREIHLCKDERGKTGLRLRAIDKVGLRAGQERRGLSEGAYWKRLSILSVVLSRWSPAALSALRALAVPRGGGSTVRNARSQLGRGPPKPRLFLSIPSPKTTGLALALCCCRDQTPAPPWAPVTQSLPSPCPPSHRDLAARLLSVDSGS